MFPFIGSLVFFVDCPIPPHRAGHAICDTPIAHIRLSLGPASDIIWGMSAPKGENHELEWKIAGSCHGGLRHGLGHAARPDTGSCIANASGL